MTELSILGGMFLGALLSAFFPFVSIELALVVSAAAGTSRPLLLGLVLVAATGEMIGKTFFFMGGRTVFGWRRRRHNAPSSRRLGRIVTRAGERRRVAGATVLVSAITGLPPFALVAGLAGGWRLRLSSFVMMGLAGRSVRFVAVLLVPGVVTWL
jgi:membrane protein YqaA with SNARE-associated domain